MPPRKSKGKKAAAEPIGRRSTRASKAAAQADPEPPVDAPSETPSSQVAKESLPSTVSETAESVANAPEHTVPPVAHEEPPPQPYEPMLVDEPESGNLSSPPVESTDPVPDVETGTTDAVTLVTPPPPTPPPSLTTEQRQAKLEALRIRMQSAAKANRDGVVDEHQKRMTTARDLARLEKQRKLAAILREKTDAEERGIDTERKKNWEYTIEENDAWEKKLKRKKGRADFEFHDDADAARKRYKKDLDQLKPDLEAYTRQKEAALGLVPGALSRAGSSKDQSLVVSSSAASTLAAEALYRDANTLTYGDNKPSEDAIDRVVSKINQDLDKKGKFSRKRVNEDEGDITYINEHNKVFNKKIARYYDKYTKEIRDSFERGTAL